MGISIGGKINYHRLLPISTQSIPTSQVAALTWQQYESKQNKYKEIFLTLSIHVAVFCILLYMVKLVFCRGVATYCNTTMLRECEVDSVGDLWEWLLVGVVDGRQTPAGIFCVPVL